MTSGLPSSFSALSAAAAVFAAVAHDVVIAALCAAFANAPVGAAVAVLCAAWAAAASAAAAAFLLARPPTDSAAGPRATTLSRPLWFTLSPSQRCPSRPSEFVPLSFGSYVEVFLLLLSWWLVCWCWCHYYCFEGVLLAPLWFFLCECCCRCGKRDFFFFI